MDRTALSKRLEGLSSVFASETPIATDLKAMAYTLNKMSDDKFKSILSSEYSADGAILVANEEKVEKEVSDTAKKEEENCCDASKVHDDEGAETMKSASEVGLYWNKEASDLILSTLVRDVTGAVLTKEQTPDGAKKAQKPATLKDDQVPSIKEVLDSDMVSKSHGAVQKEAAVLTKEQTPDGAKKAQKPAALKDDQTPSIKEVLDSNMVNKSHGAVKKEAAKAEDISPDNMGEPAKEKGSLEDMAKVEAKKVQDEEELADKSAFISEGIELNAPMIDASLDVKEAEYLSGLFA